MLPYCWLEITHLCMVDFHGKFHGVNMILKLKYFPCSGQSVVLINPQLGDKLVIGRTDELITENENLERASGKVLNTTN